MPGVLPCDASPSASAVRVARALEHPLRARVLFEYQRAPTSPSRVARGLGERLNLVAYHTRVLLDLGFVRLVRTERRGGAVEKTYEAVLEPHIEDEDWALLPARVRRALTRTAIAGMMQTAGAAAMGGGFDVGHAHVARIHLELDDDGLAELSACLRALYARAQRSAEGPAERGRDTRSHQLIVLLFEEVSPTARA
jgi:DNA-binding transcriptional ArsR family regulator